MLFLCRSFRYVGSEYGIVYVLKYDVEDRKITLLPYYVPVNVISGNGICLFLLLLDAYLYLFI